jgi:peptidoglycan hydrolase CwlO-like protein
MKQKIILITVIILTFMNTFSLAHQGRTDRYGGHYDHSTGTYHYHNGSYSGEFTAPVEEGGTRIDNSNEQNDKLTVNRNDTSNIDSILLENARDEINRKTESIQELNNKINEQEKEIQSLKEDKRWLHIIYIAIIIVMLIYGYKHLN